jgi:hypothetical protein
MHVGAGFGITLTVSSFTNKPTIGLAAGIGAGIGKEIWDSQHRGHDASVRDALATAGGSAGAWALYKFVFFRKHPQVASTQQSPQTATDTKPQTTSPPATVAVAKGAGAN